SHGVSPSLTPIVRTLSGTPPERITWPAAHAPPALRHAPQGSSFPSARSRTTSPRLCPVSRLDIAAARARAGGSSRVADGHGGHCTKALGLADDHEDADGEHVFTWWQAQDKARELARGKTAGGRPATVAEAIDDYERDLAARGAHASNARRAR